jgi:hypothetical protein
MARKTLKKRGGQQNQINSIEEIVNIITTKDPPPENQQMIFLEKNRNYINSKTPGGESLLILSIKYDRPAVFYKLLEIGADVNLQDSSGRTALMYAAYNGYINRVNKLLALGANVNIQDSFGHTALMYAEDKLNRENSSSDKIEVYDNIIQSLQQVVPERTGQYPNSSTLSQMQVAPEITGREITQGRNFNQGLNDKRAQFNGTRYNFRSQSINNLISEKQRKLEQLRKKNAEMELKRANSGIASQHYPPGTQKNNNGKELEFHEGPGGLMKGEPEVPPIASDYLKQLQERTKQIELNNAEIEKRTENIRKMRKEREEEENSKSEEEKNADAEYDELTEKLKELVIKYGHDSNSVEMAEIKKRMNKVHSIRKVEQQKRRDLLGLTSNSQFNTGFGDVNPEGDVSEKSIQEIGEGVEKRLDQPMFNYDINFPEYARIPGGKSRKRQISRTSKTRKSNGKGSRKHASRKQMEIKQMARKHVSKKSRRSIKKR